MLINMLQCFYVQIHATMVLCSNTVCRGFIFKYNLQCFLAQYIVQFLYTQILFSMVDTYHYTFTIHVVSCSNTHCNALMLKCILKG